VGERAERTKASRKLLQEGALQHHPPHVGQLSQVRREPPEGIRGHGEDPEVGEDGCSGGGELEEVPGHTREPPEGAGPRRVRS